ncbi:vicilin-like seed storage protein At2g18540 [Penaeus chinensis]|uniref:vicilin-like seed storage protein At2g18540 n=1 Tax=Penaeus chinensis TaxID=139456 RepID=UPI001FB6FFD5|nr:vicilin-like seed storage protein At2g18540 [Penaeus chinensis]
MPVPLGPSSHRTPSPHTTMLPPGPLTPPPEDGWTWPLPENSHRNVHGNDIYGIASSNNRGNVYGDIHNSTQRNIVNERPTHVHNTHDSQNDDTFDETDPTVQAGYRHCLREAVRFLVHVEHLSWDDPIVRGLLEHLALPRAHDELQRIVETLNTDKEEEDEKEEGEEELDEKEEEETEEKDQEESESYSSSSSFPVFSLSSASDLASSLRNVGYKITLTEDSDEEEDIEKEDKEEEGRMLDMEEIERELTEMQRREEEKAEERRQRDERERREKRQREEEEEEEERERREKRRREEQVDQISGENQRQIHTDIVEAEKESQRRTEEERDIQIEIENQRESDKEREKQRAEPITMRNEEMRKQLLRYVYQGCDLIVTPAPLPSPAMFLARHHM